MAKRNALEENLQTIMGETAKTISRGTSGKGTQNEATDAEKKERAHTMKTQGRKGCKVQRVNMAFSDTNYDFLRVVAKIKGDSITTFVNFIVDKYREEHADAYRKAKEIQEEL